MSGTGVGDGGSAGSETIAAPPSATLEVGPGRPGDHWWSSILARESAGGVAILIGVVVYALLNNNPYGLEVGSNIATFGLAAIGLTLVVGAAGQLALGQAGFMAIGGYAVALLTLKAGFSFFPALLVGSAAAGVAGLVVGYIALRLQGNYLAVATLAFGALIPALADVNGPFGGPAGLSGIGIPTIGPLQFTSPLSQYVLPWVVVGLAFVGGKLLLHSRLGRQTMAMRDDELASRCVGISVTRRKVQIFVIGAVLAGLAGTMMAAIQGTVAPNTFGPTESLQIFLMIVLGGLGSMSGAIVGAAIVVEIIQIVPGTGAYALTALGAVVIVLMMVAPRGGLDAQRAAVWLWQQARRRLSDRRAVP
ncbi:MAG: branched-chain amino acid ABC transporter permease [Acidimicrobiales bacterium]